MVSLDALAESLSDDTLLVSVMLANNEVGTVQPLREIARMAHSAGALVHTDAVQAVGKMPVDIDELDVDLLSLTAHKFHGPKSAGALYVRPGVQLEAQVHGGQQERSLCPGTENVAGIVGLAEALERATAGVEAGRTRLENLRQRLLKGIETQIEAVQVNGHPTSRLPNILNLSFAGTDGESLLLALDSQGVAVSTGSACSAGSAEPSHVLTAMGLDSYAAGASLRFSLGHGNTEAEIEYVLQVLPGIVERFREMSPSGVWNG
jgi:cysteine desulfurase